jgi:hypothetical protein
MNIFILISLLLIILLYKLPFFLLSSENIVAKQSNYWGIKKDDILNTTFFDLVEKRDRLEYVAPKIEEIKNNNFIKWDGNVKLLNQNFILLHLKEYNSFTILKEKSVLKYLKNTENKLFKEVFKKIEEFIDKKEIHVDYEDVFEKNSYCVEFFLLELWEKNSLVFNYGIGTLQAYLYDGKLNLDKDKEIFLYALAATITSTIHRKGMPLYFYYYYYKKKHIEQESRRGIYV